MILDDGLNVSEHVEEDENYFISMTDMMVGVLFIFLIMLMLFALNFRKQTDISEERIAQLEQKEQQLELKEDQLKRTQARLQQVSEVADEVARKLDDLRSEVGDELSAMAQAKEVRSQLLNALRDQLRAQGLDVQIDEANGILRLTENAIHFPVDSSDLDEKATINVDKVASALASVLPAFTACRRDSPSDQCIPLTGGAAVETVFIEGHTDSTGGDNRNWPLSTDRAVNTYREITSFAPALRNLENSGGKEILSVSGYASTRAIDPGDTPAAYEKNRRIDLRFVMEDASGRRLQEILAVTGRMKEQLDRLHDSVEKVQ